MRKLLAALMVAAFLGGVPGSLAASSPAPTCKRHGKPPKFKRLGKYKAPKFKNRKQKKPHIRAKSVS